ncbi:hypothetical protein [Bacteroides sp. 224]|uniref:hypothetical protein n=1 Tax=Bacteroides sp. 224 TaxID=2302936 RepID=UPI0013D576CD|nr:hypothetical protein [Bacteroides sp. 224]
MRNINVRLWERDGHKKQKKKAFKALLDSNLRKNKAKRKKKGKKKRKAQKNLNILRDKTFFFVNLG